MTGAKNQYVSLFPTSERAIHIQFWFSFRKIAYDIFARFSSYSPLAFGVRFCFARWYTSRVFSFRCFAPRFLPPNFPRINNGAVKIYGSISGEQTTAKASSFGRYWQQWARAKIWNRCVYPSSFSDIDRWLMRCIYKLNRWVSIWGLEWWCWYWVFIFIFMEIVEEFKLLMKLNDVWFSRYVFFFLKMRSISKWYLVKSANYIKKILFNIRDRG